MICLYKNIFFFSRLNRVLNFGYLNAKFQPVGSHMWAVTVITKIMNIVRNVIMMVIVRMIING